MSELKWKWVLDHLSLNRDGTTTLGGHYEPETAHDALVRRTRELAAKMRIRGWKAQVKVRPSGVYLSAQAIHRGKPEEARAMVRDALPDTRQTSGSYGEWGSDWRMTWRIL